MVAKLSYHCTNRTENYSLIAHLQMKLRLVEVGKLDACIRPLFANSVTYLKGQCVNIVYPSEAIYIDYAIKINHKLSNNISVCIIIIVCSIE